jgi:hypothetical protein
MINMVHKRFGGDNPDNDDQSADPNNDNYSNSKDDDYDTDTDSAILQASDKATFCDSGMRFLRDLAAVRVINTRWFGKEVLTCTNFRG